MKATERHQELCELVRNQANFWASSNDIDSSTHLSDIDETVSQIEFLEEGKQEVLKNDLRNLYYTIRSFGK